MRRISCYQRVKMPQNRKRKSADRDPAIPEKTTRSGRRRREVATTEPLPGPSSESSQNNNSNDLDNQAEETIRSSFRENDDTVTMSVRGMYTDFQTDQDDSDGEVTFSSQESQNNNATVARNSKAKKPVKRSYSAAEATPSEADTVMDPPDVLECTGVTSNQDGGAGASSLLGDEEKQRLINETVTKTMEQLMAQGRLRLEAEGRPNELQKFKKGKNTVTAIIPDNDVAQNKDSVYMSNSKVTIYQRAVPDKDQTGVNQVSNQRESTSSEEGADTSDEQLDAGNKSISPDDNQFLNRSFNQNVTVSGKSNKNTAGDEQPSTSRGAEGRKSAERVLTPEEHAEKLIREAELSRAQVFETPGNLNVQRNQHNAIDLANNFVHSVMVDENYRVVGGHLDLTMRTKIINNEYVDFAKLLPKDRIQLEEERAQWTIKNGMPYCVPLGEITAISSFSKWEQAFRVFSAIYTKAYPHRANELIQYSHIIHTASMSYYWDNVYGYDKDFRLHMSEFPSRCWSVILQQAWALRLKDKIRQHNDSGRSNAPQVDYGKREICKRFNRGRCTYGFRCKYEHRCSFCFKMGHGVHNCRKMGSGDYSSNGNYNNRDNKPDGGPQNNTNHTRTNKELPVKNTNFNKVNNNQQQGNQ